MGRFNVEIGILRHFADRFNPEARVRTTAYERMCEGPVVAASGSLSNHKSSYRGSAFSAGADAQFGKSKILV